MADSIRPGEPKNSARCLWQEVWLKRLWPRPSSADYFLHLLFSPTDRFSGNRDSCLR